jgi:hypothetical protein
MVATDSPSDKLGITARKQAVSIRGDEMPPCAVLEGVRWVAVVVNWILAVGVGERDWDVRVMPRVVWMDVLRTEEVRDWVYEFGDNMIASILAALRISLDKKGYVRPDVISDSSDM